ncbi:TetR/AcrR family transcriptional regulator [Dactylosporangium fulvum]|uniref:TetR/AcrR family transcriptional regulator n=1 Tax=Dactylosporangium fulvum TaxID=53359 RepID=A0ABY5VTA9_9ACTN|nr:TetR/AcrR family transcriptional regulator [Dactylosporangium fulvum]UWP80071.1 TetR/AcrR family transcriptional regulator [Dactylosporangium fulvum]
MAARRGPAARTAPAAVTATPSAQAPAPAGTTTARRGARADARRNYERLVAAATEAFREHGTEASLDGIAQRANVGNATLYRHFPTREALIEAVVRERFEQLAANEPDPASTDPAEALGIWLREFVAYTQSFQVLPGSVLASLREPTGPLQNSCSIIQAAATRLLTEAQRTGAVRSDVNAIDLLIQATGIAWATDRGPADPNRVERLLTLLMDGLRQR